MSVVSQKGVRLHALAAATAVALSSLVAAPAFAGKVELGGLQSAQTHDRFIVKYRAGSDERSDVAKANAGLARAAAGVGRADLGVRHLRHMSMGADVVKANRKLDRAEAETLMRQIAADPNVEYVEVDQLMKPVFSPNDTYYTSEQWHYYDATGGIKADQAWDVTSGAGVVVAVIDTGITNHTDLNANILPGYDFINDAAMARDGDGRDANPNDEGDWYATNECGLFVPGANSSWHGTHVAGTVAAVTNNALGVAGVAHGAKVVPVRVLGKCGGYTSDIADGIIWASGGTVAGVPANANPAEVINMSLGGSGSCSATYQNAINGAVGRGTTVVIAAGNSNVNVSGAVPANCANVIAVASTTNTGQRSSFSNYGTMIDIAAPGSDIMSTLNTGTTVPGTQAYASYNGTSMATPHVAGVVALVQAVATTPKTPAEIEALIKSTARAFPVTPTQTIGPGILDARAAVDAANAAPPPPPVTQTYTNSADYTINNKSTVNSPVAVSGRTGNGLATSTVAVDIVHTAIGDLKVDLVAPDGTLYNLHNRTGGTADNINTSYTVNLSAEAMNGTWNLRVYDAVNGGNTGYINSWSVTF